jgi:predicted Ser/Thr protein kinase
LLPGGGSSILDSRRSQWIHGASAIPARRKEGLLPSHVSRTPFGNPDGSRSDIQDVVDNFVTFDELAFAGGLRIRTDDLSSRVIVGAKGSGKTVYLRRLRAAAAHNESVYADVVQQDLPTTSNIVKFCQCFSKQDLTEKWMQLWYCAIMRSLVTHILHAKKLSTYLTVDQREELSHYPPDIVPDRRREVSAYSQVTEIINRFHTAHAFSKFFDDPAWAELSSTVNEIITALPPVYFFIDSVDEEYTSAPMYWLQCQKGLFYRAMRFLRDQHFGGRLHVVVCVRDHVLASVLRGEHQNRYRGEPHITTLGWEYAAAEFFMKEKIARLGVEYCLRSPEGDHPRVEHWLGHTFIENRARGIREPILQYLLRHTRLLPRDIVILGNRLSECVAAARHEGLSEVPAEIIRQCVREVARSFGNEQLAICGNHIASSSMPPDAARKGYANIYTGDTEFTRGLADDLRNVVRLIGKDRFAGEDLELAIEHALGLFGEGSDALSVLWQNRLLGYLEATPDGPQECFFSEVNCDHFNLPLDKTEYLFHSCMIDCADIQSVGPPVGQGAMQVPSVRARPAPSSPERVGNYRVLGVLGRGGMGTVYLAEDQRLKRRVAVKILPRSATPSSRTLRRFEREAQILANLNHPNIATLYSLEDDEGLHFITMEYVPGVTLSQFIRAESPDTARTTRICWQIAAALDAAHRQRVIHRDLKPANIMVTQQDHVKVLDFGLGKVVRRVVGDGSTTRSMDSHPSAPGGILGTPGYMSPEQLMGRRVDHRSDIWAFGCCLYECLSGRMAFGGETGPERMAATLEREPDFQALAALPGPLHEILRQTLEKNPARRLASLSSALELLAQVGVA